MDEPVFHDANGRPYTVRDGVSVWLDEGAAPIAVSPAPVVGAAVDATGMEYVGWGPRAGARVIDTVLVNVLAFAVQIPLGIAIGAIAVMVGVPTDPIVAKMNQTGVLNYVVAFVAAVAFGTVAEAMHGSTPGKMMLGLTVRGEDGGFCGWMPALLRSIAYFVDSLFIGLVAYLSMQGNPRKQRIGDKWGHTVVVRTRSLDPSQRRTTSRFVGATAVACLVYTALVSFNVLIRL